MTRLQEVTGVEVRSFDSFVKALEQRIESLWQMGVKQVILVFGKSCIRELQKKN